MDEKIEGRMRAVCRLIDTFNDWLGGYVFAPLALPLLYVVAYEVISRYVFDAPTDWSYELSYMLYGSFFMLGAGYTLLKGGHVRTDIFYNNWSFRTRGILDSLLYVIAFYPGMIFFF
jgi:TRAP-type mannitol/chloroaromatic compound transport system permease small subunit